MNERQHGIASHERNRAKFSLEIACALIAVMLASCATAPLTPGKPATPVATEKPLDLPLQPSAVLPMPPPPRQTGKTETFNVTVRDVPVADVLFVLARDAKLGLDISPKVVGQVTLIAVDQTLQQILNRIAEQVDMRYEFRDSSIVVKADTAFDRQYKIDYVNIERESKSASNISTQIQAASNGAVSGGGGGGGESNNNSTSELTSTSRNQFWRTLTANVRALVGDVSAPASAPSSSPPSPSAPSPSSSAPTGGPQSSAGSPATATAATTAVATVSIDGSFVIANAETGLLVVRATARQHERVQQYLDVMLRSAHRQVLIEATVAEVQLSNQYQQGINWQKLNSGSFSATQQPMGPAPLPGGSIPGSGPGGITFPASLTPLATPSLAVLQYVSSPGSFLGNLSVAVSLLESFGTVKVLSSPKLSVLNNQTAFLKVVDNRIYFTINVQVTPGTTTGAQAIVTYTSTPATVPVGFVMSVTPSIDESGMVTMDVRPTISRIIDYVNDPNPALAQARVVSQIPEIQTREIESLLRVKSGDIAVMGGLMQDTKNNSTDEVPGLGRIPWLGNLFKYKNDIHTKSELVIFLRPVVIRDASLEGDFQDYKKLAEREGVSKNSGSLTPLSATP
jgi:MSHA biogenesis protein MshL